MNVNRKHFAFFVVFMSAGLVGGYGIYKAFFAHLPVVVDVRKNIIKESGTFAIVNLKKISTLSKIGMDLECRMKDINLKAQDEFVNLENKIKSMESSKNGTVDARKIEDTQIMLYDVVRDKRKQIDSAYHKSISELEKVLREAVENVSKEKGLTITFDSDAVIASSLKCIDITDDVIAKIDKKWDPIKIDMSGE